MIECYGTLGPACVQPEVLEKMLRAGMCGVRLNLSHLSLSEAAPEIRALRQAEANTGLRCKLLVDMQGPELRIGALREPLELREGEEISLDLLKLPDALRNQLTPGQELLLDDGKLLVRLTGADRALVLRGGILQSRKSVAAPGLTIRLPALTEADRENIRQAKEYGVDEVMQPFVRSREDLEELRQALEEAGCGHVKIYAKIENREGVAHLRQLMPAADVIVIARGDLGNAMPLWELPRVQKEISEVCREQGIPFLVVTQMLASMERSPVPTRAEVSDIFNAVLDGAAAVMVTGETAVGDYPVHVMEYLCRCAGEAERYRKERGE